MNFPGHSKNVLIKGPAFFVFAYWVLLTVLFLCLTPPCRADDLSEEEQIKYLKGLTLEHLLGIEVTSVSKKTQPLSAAPAAIYVITAEDIRRSGVTSIPEALRMVPGLEVAKIDSNKWAVTARGFNGRTLNKLLVLIDGRSIYSLLYSGVPWDIQEVLLEDLDRIEVIRGPGATMWGANAVNGVINIITKHSKETQGGFVSAGYGTEERGFGSVRYGASMGDDAFFRVYAKGFHRDEQKWANGDDAHDNWEGLCGGFRADWSDSDKNSFTLQGDIYDNQSGQSVRLQSLVPPYEQVVNDDIVSRGGNALFRWTRTLAGSETQLQIYYDRSEYKEVMAQERKTVYDFDFQHDFEMSDNQSVIWGVAYRHEEDRMIGSENADFDPKEEKRYTLALFTQDEISFLEDKLFLTIGSKFEHNSSTGFEVQPSARISWLPEKNHTFWASISRAVRIPSRGERSSRIPFMTLGPGVSPNFDPLNPGQAVLFGKESLQPESLIAYELGYRFHFKDRFMLDLAGFFNDYDRLVFSDVGIPSFRNNPVPYWVWPVYPSNNGQAETYGFEMAGLWRISDNFRIYPAYTFLQMKVNTGLEEGFNPRHQFSMRTSLDLPRGLELDIWPRYVDELPKPGISDYFTMDLRLGWKPAGNLEISLVGRNLLDKQHPEFGEDTFMQVLQTEVERSVYVKIAWNF